MQPCAIASQKAHTFKATLRNLQQGDCHVSWQDTTQTHAQQWFLSDWLIRSLPVCHGRGGDTGNKDNIARGADTDTHWGVMRCYPWSAGHCKWQGRHCPPRNPRDRITLAIVVQKMFKNLWPISHHDMVVAIYCLHCFVLFTIIVTQSM